MLQDNAALVAQVLAGDKSAFAPLIDRHRPGAIRLARRLLGDSADAEDVVQEALPQAFLGSHDLRRPERFGAWLLGIVVNSCRMQLRSRHAVYPKEVAGARILPIWVGVVDGDLLAMQLANISPVRPLAYDLMARLLQVAEVPVERVAVTQLRDNIFYATIWVKVGDRVREVDARPSDALNLALRVRALIFVAPELFEHARVTFLTQEGAPSEGGYVVRKADGRQMRGPELLPLLDEWHRQDLEEQGLPPETPERAYRSFRSLPRSPRGVPEMGYGPLPRRQNPDQPAHDRKISPPGGPVR